MKKFKINYKKGHSMEFLAYSVEYHDGKYYVCGISYAGDNPEWYTIKGDHIASIEEV